MSARFTFPQPPPASLVFQRPQQQISPLQAFQLSLQAQQMRQNQERLARADARAAAESAIRAQREQLQLEKLQLDLDERRETRQRERDVRQATVRARREQPGTVERRVAERELEAIDPNALTDFVMKERDRRKAVNEFTDMLAMDTITKSVRSRRLLSELAKIKPNDPNNQQLLAQWLAQVEAAEDAGRIPRGLLPRTRIPDEQIVALQDRLNLEARIANRPGLFSFRGPLQIRAEQLGLTPGSPEWMEFIRNAEKEERRNARSRATRALVNFSPTGQAAQPTKGAAAKLQVGLLSAEELSQAIRRVEHLLIEPKRDNNGNIIGAPAGVRILGGMKNAGFRIGSAISDFGFEGFGQGIFDLSDLSDEDIATLDSSTEAVTQILDTWRILITGLAAPEKELQRIEARIKLTRRFESFVPRFFEFKLRALRAQHIRERMLWEGFGGDQAAFNRAITSEEGLKGPNRALAKKFWDELGDVTIRENRGLPPPVTNFESLAENRHLWNQRVRKMTPQDSLLEMWQHGFVDADLAERVEPKVDFKRLILGNTSDVTRAPEPAVPQPQPPPGPPPQEGAPIVEQEITATPADQSLPDLTDTEKQFIEARVRRENPPKPRQFKNRGAYETHIQQLLQVEYEQGRKDKAAGKPVR